MLDSRQVSLNQSGTDLPRCKRCEESANDQPIKLLGLLSWSSATLNRRPFTYLICHPESWRKTKSWWTEQAGKQITGHDSEPSACLWSKQTAATFEIRSNRDRWAPIGCRWGHKWTNCSWLAWLNWEAAQSAEVRPKQGLDCYYQAKKHNPDS